MNDIFDLIRKEIDFHRTEYEKADSNFQDWHRGNCNAYLKCIRLLEADNRPHNQALKSDAANARCICDKCGQPHSYKSSGDNGECAA